MERKPEFKQKVLNNIKTGVIEAAADVRKIAKLTKAKSKAGSKVLDKWVEGKLSLEDAVSVLEEQGDANAIIQRCARFRESLSGIEIDNELIKLEGEALKKCEFELNKIQKRIEQLLKKIDKKNQM
jgi:exonuclease VII small subunit